MYGKHFYTAHDFCILPVNDHKRGVKTCEIFDKFNPVKTKLKLLYLKTQSVPRSKHFSSRL